MRRWMGLILSACLVPTSGAADTDGLWETTTTMEVSGPVSARKDRPKRSMTPLRQTVCIAEGAQDENKLADCKVADRHRSGLVVKTTLQCKGSTMKMEREAISKDHWRSVVETTSSHRGKKSVTITRREAKRIGSCDAAKESAARRESRKALGDAGSDAGSASR